METENNVSFVAVSFSNPQSVGIGQGSVDRQLVNSVGVWTTTGVLLDNVCAERGTYTIVLWYNRENSKVTQTNMRCLNFGNNDRVIRIGPFTSLFGFASPLPYVAPLRTIRRKRNKRHFSFYL